MVPKFGLLFVISFGLIASSQSAKILTVFPTPSPSHFFLGSAYAQGLLNSGHSVTMISPYNYKNASQNALYREIVLTGFIEMQQAMTEQVQKNPFGFSTIANMFTMLINITEKTIIHPEVQQLLQSGEKFDVVVISATFNDALKVFGSHFNAHIISFSTLGLSPMINSVNSNPYPPSYCPELILGYTTHMNFFERLTNTLFQNIMLILSEMFIHPRNKELVEKYFPDAPPYDEIRYNTSLVLLNDHESLNAPTPRVPHLINIGGFHVQKPKELPQDLQEFLDNATEGVIYFSMGSNLKSKDLGVDIRDAFLKAFEKTKLKVLWKWEDDVLPGKPKNVKLGKWLPQSDILAHKNVKLFITHGGLLSTTEAVYHGVPLLALPVFGDQKLNAATIKAAGFGLVIPKDEVTEEKLTVSINELLTNPKFTEVAKTKSRVMHDRQNSPLETAVYWTEYVIRHNGARHLRVAAFDLHWYQYYLLDVGLFLLACIISSILIVKLIYKAIKKCLIKMFKKDNKVKQH